MTPMELELVISNLHHDYDQVSSEMRESYSLWYAYQDELEGSYYWDKFEELQDEREEIMAHLQDCYDELSHLEWEMEKEDEKEVLF